MAPQAQDALRWMATTSATLTWPKQRLLGTVARSEYLQSLKGYTVEAPHSMLETIRYQLFGLHY
jgi:hypothetical protein